METKDKMENKSSDKFLPFYQPYDNLNRKYDGGYLGNFYSCNVTIKFNDKEYKFTNTEIPFQAGKATTEADFAKFTKLTSPGDSFKLGKRIKLRDDWEDYKITHMYEILKCKFEQNSGLKDKLLATNDSYLVEHTHKDKYWGDGGDGKGFNMLGKLLMKVRGELGGKGERDKPPSYLNFVKK